MRGDYVRKIETPEDTKMRVSREFIIKFIKGVSLFRVEEGRIFKRCSAICNTSTQYVGGRRA